MSVRPHRCVDALRCIGLGLVLASGVVGSAPARAAGAQDGGGDAAGAPPRFSFAIVATATDREARTTASLLRAVNAGTSSFVVHFERAAASPAACGDAALERRRALFAPSAKPIVPIVAASQWAACGRDTSDSLERLDRIGDLFYGSDQSFGDPPLAWSRQSGVPRFRRYRENLRWQVGRVLFAAINLPDNNNNYRIGAGRNGEFEERSIANRAWLERTFRMATERRALGLVLFVDASPHFATPLRAPDSRSRDRDGYYEWKLALRDAMATFGGRVLLVQGRRVTATPPRSEGPTTTPEAPDHPLRDAAGRPIDRFDRIGAIEAAGDLRWLRIDVDPADPALFRPVVEQAFDDPSGELYGRAGPAS